MRKLIAGAVVAGAFVLGSSGVAFGHSVSVETSSGQTNCQFMGGPGNPGHQGHSHGHPQAIAHEQSETVSIGSC